MIYKWNLLKMIQMNLLTNRNRFTGIENKLIITKRKKKGRDKLGVWNEQIHTTIYKI